MKSPGCMGIVPMLTFALCLFSFVSSSAFQKATPTIAITTPSNGLEGTSLQLTVNRVGSSSALTWSVSDISGHAVIDGTTLKLQQAGTVKLKLDIAEDLNYSAYTIYKLVTIQSASTEKPDMAQVWGTFSYGGAGNSGVLFRMNADGTGYTLMSELVTDPGGVGAFYGGPTVTSDGMVYGVLGAGGDHNAGVIYRYNPTNQEYKVVYHFNPETGTFPNSALVEHSNGMLYGVANAGGANMQGVLYSFDRSDNSYQVIVNFDGDIGSFPASTPRVGSNGKLYGVTPYGGFYASGVLYEYDPATEHLEVIRNFVSSEDGRGPTGAPRFASNGKLYGATTGGGTTGFGTIYEYDPAASFNKFHVMYNLDFSEGSYDQSGFSEETVEGKMYLSLVFGGSSSGTLISYVPGSTSIDVVKNFDCDPGCSPYSAPLLSSDGKIYGILTSGTVYGMLYKYDPEDGAFITSYLFERGHVSSGVAEAADGTLYGTSGGDGLSSGFLYSLDRNLGHLTVIKEHYNSLEGTRPKGALAVIDNEVWFNAYVGGQTDEGTILEFNMADNVLTKKLDFNSINTGEVPNGWIKHSNGKLYQVTTFGGDASWGALTEYDPQTFELNKRYNFQGNNSGKIGAIDGTVLIEGSDGMLYGIGQGGTNFNEVIYAFSPTSGELGIVYAFGPPDEEGSSHRGFCLGPDNTLWGIARSRGSHDSGLIFKFNLTTKEFTAVFNFDDAANGITPNAGLVMASNGKLYGVASGGDSNKGLIYEVDPSNGTYTVKKSFTAGFAGNEPFPLMKGINGKLIGNASLEGDNNLGFIYTYDPKDNSIEIVKSLSYDIGYRRDGRWLLVKRNPVVALNIGDKTFGDNPFGVEFQSNGDGDITYTALTDNITISNKQVTIVRAGLAKIEAKQTEGDNFNAATKTTPFCINPPKPTVTSAGTSTITLTSSANENNQWFRNGEAITGATSKTYQVTQNGTYVVKTKVDICESAFSDAQMVTITGLEDDIENLVRIYPNPTSHELLVDLPAAETPIQLSLIDHLGRSIESRTAQPRTTQKFEVAQLPASLYILRVVKDGKMISKVFIKR